MHEEMDRYVSLTYLLIKAIQEPFPPQHLFNQPNTTVYVLVDLPFTILTTF